MANKKTEKIKINKEVFLKVLSQKNCSIRQLGRAYEEIERTEKTIRSCLNEGEMPPDLLDRIAKYLDVHPDYLSGAYNEKADKIEDAYLKHLYWSTLDKDNYPHLLKAKSDIDYNSYFEDTLLMNDITIEQFRTLPPEERVLLRQELVVAILEVFSKHFKENALGKSISEELDYYSSFVGDTDPTSYFANLEGIGISEDEIEFEYDEESQIEFEKRMQEKYGHLDN